MKQLFNQIKNNKIKKKITLEVIKNDILEYDWSNADVIYSSSL